MQKNKPGGGRKTGSLFCAAVSLMQKSRLFLFQATFLFVVSALLLPACAPERKPAALEEGEKEIEEQPGIKILDYRLPEGEFYRGDTVQAEITVQNNTGREESFFAGCSIKDPLGRDFDLPATAINLADGEKDNVAFSWLIPAKTELEDLISGPYKVITALWSEQPGTEGAQRLATLEKEAPFHILNHTDHFTTFDNTRWEKSSHRLGLGHLDPGNVTTMDNKLAITLPEGTYDGGEIKSAAADHLYGSYRARLKLPDVPSSITGFFLYKAPDFKHEIDIEIVNGPCGTIWFTTYASGEVSNTHETSLDFDPTADFHEYRFDLYPGEINFYVEGELLQSFGSGLPEEPMYLMLNAWFPDWLDGEKPQEAKTVLIDWIKY